MTKPRRRSRWDPVWHDDPEVRKLPHGMPMHVEVAETGCWIWTGAKKQSGKYGFAYGIDGRLTSAHRAAYEALVGPIPDGLQIDHLCRVTLCVNPAHLEPVTQYENLMRGQGWPAINAAKTHCKRGHLFDAANTITTITPAGRAARQCRTCRAAYMAAWRAKRRAPREPVDRAA